MESIRIKERRNRTIQIRVTEDEQEMYKKLVGVDVDVALMIRCLLVETYNRVLLDDSI